MMNINRKLALLTQPIAICALFAFAQPANAGLWDDIKESVADMWDSTKEVSSDAWESGKEKSSDAWQATKETTADTASSAWEATKETGNDLKDGAAKKWQEATSDTPKEETGSISDIKKLGDKETYVEAWKGIKESAKNPTPPELDSHGIPVKE